MKLAVSTELLLLLSALAARCSAQCVPSLSTASGRYAPSGQLCQDQLIFNENFDNFNMDLWEHEKTMNGGGNGEFQWYTNSRRNTYVQDGVLYIRPTLTTDVIPDLNNCHIQIPDCTNGCEHWCSADYPAPPIQSGRIKSTNSFAFKYGRVVIRAKLPSGDWLWPALWFMPKYSVYGQWPRSGEIDLMESRGNWNMYADNRHIGIEQFGSTLHFGTEYWNSAWWSSNFVRNTAPGQGLNNDFHLYQMEWAPTHISFSLDNQWIGTIPTGDGYFRRGQFSGNNPWSNGGSDAPYDQEFYFIMNLAVGGTNGFFPEAGNAGGKPWNNKAQFSIRDFWNGRNQWLGSWNLGTTSNLDSSLRVDYIRVYAL